MFIFLVFMLKIYIFRKKFYLKKLINQFMLIKRTFPFIPLFYKRKIVIYLLFYSSYVFRQSVLAVRFCIWIYPRMKTQYKHIYVYQQLIIHSALEHVSREAINNKLLRRSVRYIIQTDPITDITSIILLLAINYNIVTFSQKIFQSQTIINNNNEQKKRDKLIYIVIIIII